MVSTTTNPDLTPAIIPPPGVTSNLLDPPSQGYLTIIIMVLLLSLTTPTVLVRMYTRHFINQRLWWDDYAAVVAWVGLCGLAGIMFDWLKYGAGTDLWNVSLAHAARFKQLFKLVEIVARISMFFTKLSILLLFLRIFNPPRTQKTKGYYVIWFVIWFNLLYCLALVLLVLLQCVGKGKTPESECVDQYFVLITASIINVLSDMVMLAIPLIAVWDLHMPKERKLRLLAVFSVGAIAIATSLARLGWQIKRANDPNQTLILMNVTLLHVAEQSAGIIVGCMPALPAFFRYLSDRRSKLRSSKSRCEGHSIGLGSSTFGNWNAKTTRKGSNDPPNQSREYQELDDSESGRKQLFSFEGMTTTIKAGCSEPSFSEETVKSLNNGPHNVAHLSRSVQVESHPSTREEGCMLPQRVAERARMGGRSEGI